MGVGEELTEPVINPQVWNEVPHEHICKAIGFAQHGENANGDCETDITEQDEFSILRFVERAGWVEMVHTASKAILLSDTTPLKLFLMVVVSSNVGEYVQRPAN